MKGRIVEMQKEKEQEFFNWMDALNYCFKLFSLVVLRENDLEHLNSFQSTIISHISIRTHFYLFSTMFLLPFMFEKYSILLG